MQPVGLHLMRFDMKMCENAAEGCILTAEIAAEGCNLSLLTCEMQPVGLHLTLKSHPKCEMQPVGLHLTARIDMSHRISSCELTRFSQIEL